MRRLPLPIDPPSRGGNWLHILRTETQQRSNIAHFVELRIILHVERLNIAANHPRQNGLPDIDNFLRGPATNRTGADQVGIDVPASGTFDGVSLKVFA